jgi:hypothetical protein
MQASAEGDRKHRRQTKELSKQLITQDARQSQPNEIRARWTQGFYTCGYYRVLEPYAGSLSHLAQ